MKITVNQLRRIIKEEVQASLNELKKKPRAVQPGALTLRKYIPTLTKEDIKDLIGDEDGLFYDPGFEINLKSEIIPIKIDEFEAKSQSRVTHKFYFVEDPDKTPISFGKYGFQYSDS